ncbi:MAG: LPS export ABC transporter periplasmic protein LptC [Desulfobacca sp.]|uniref:LPS export ABC transporter periplasmic protein LptC n=1 Tax=Desulfobacca sp. TaxID=2067990 RepID=UPI004049F273
MSLGNLRLWLLATWCLAGSLVLPLAAADQPPAPPPLAPEKQGEMQEILLTEIQEGDKKWVLRAANADFVREKDRIVLSRVWVEIFGLEGGSLIITGDTGSIGIKSRDLTLTGNVQATGPDYTFASAEVHYHPQTRILSAPGPITLESPHLSVEGRNLTVDLKTHKLELAQHDKTQLRLRGRLWNF